MSDEHRVEPRDFRYPALLRRIPDPPGSLNIRGDITRQDLLSVAVVGSRNPTSYGLHMARIISGGLAVRGMTIISGLARGIDTEAHKAALDLNGRTIAVLGCGLDINYPRGTEGLKQRISKSGALISEFEPGTPPLPHHFPSRNRIISGLALAVVIVQAGLKSGSLITARWALDQGRDVFAVPGRANDPLSEGPIALIKDGAAPVCSAEDIIHALGLDMAVSNKENQPSRSEDPDPVIRALEPGPQRPEDLSRKTGIPIHKLLSELSRLELEGAVSRDHGGQFFLK